MRVSDIDSRISHHRARFGSVCWPQMHAVFLHRMLYVKLIPVCNPNSVIESQAGADSSQRQRFKGQNQQQEAILVKKTLTHIVMGNSWSVCGVVQSYALASSSDCACVKILVLPPACVCLFSAGYTSLSLSAALSLVSWVNACWPHSSLEPCLDLICFCQDKRQHRDGILMWEMQSFSSALNSIYDIYLAEMESLSGIPEITRVNTAISIGQEKPLHHRIVHQC